MKYTGDNLQDVMDAHIRWLKNGGENDEDRADFSGANLRGAVMPGFELYAANFRGADLSGADLYQANLSRADLTGAILHRTNLYHTNLRGAIGVPFIPQRVPDTGSFIAWKKAYGRPGCDGSPRCVIVKLLIPEDARRIGLTDGECRADKALVLEIQTMEGEPIPDGVALSMKDLKTVYRPGETVTAPNFGTELWNKWTPGIYFCINRQEAVEYGTGGMDAEGNLRPVDIEGLTGDGLGIGTPPAVLDDPVIEQYAQGVLSWKREEKKA